jgi:hypothetical protein
MEFGFVRVGPKYPQVVLFHVVTGGISNMHECDCLTCRRTVTSLRHRGGLSLAAALVNSQTAIMCPRVSIGTQIPNGTECTQVVLSNFITVALVVFVRKGMHVPMKGLRIKRKRRVAREADQWCGNMGMGRK